MLIVRDEFPGWLLLGGLLSSRARLRFTNRPQYALGNQRWHCLSANGNLSLISVSQRRGAVQRIPGFTWRRRFSTPVVKRRSGAVCSG